MNINTISDKEYLESIKYQQLFESNENAVLEIDKTGKITRVNPCFCYLFEYKQSEIMGADIGFFIHDASTGISFKAHAEKLIDPQDISVEDFFGIKKTGTVFQANVLMRRKDFEKNPTFFVAIGIHQPISLKNKLELNEYKLRQSQQYANIGHWHYDLTTQDFEFSDEAKALLNIVNLDNFFPINALILQVSTKSELDKLQLAIEACLKGQAFNEEIKLAGSDGKNHWVHFQGNLEWRNNRPFCIHGIIQDISARKVKESEALSSTFIIEHSLDEIFIFDCASLLLLKVNKLACHDLGFSAEELTQMHLYDVLIEFNATSFQQLLSPLSQAEQDKMRLKTRALRKDGSEYFIELKIRKTHYKDKEVYIAFADDVTDRENLIDELYQAKDIAEHANQAKSDFLSRMSHELRTPMNAILGFSQLMTLNNVTSLDENQLDNLGEITKAGDHLLTLINEVLELSKVESGRVSISLENLDVQQLVKDICLFLQPVAQNYDTSIVNHIKEPAYLLGDRMRLKQVLLNLLSNAIKYGKQGGIIIIDYQANEQGQGVISITDQGQGIAQDKIHSIFDPFERLEQEGGTIEGTGIGLTISKKMTELMGGEIGLESEVGKGSCFWVALPYIKSLENTSDLKVKAPHKVLKSIDASHKSILYIEDNPANLKLVERILSTYSNCHFLHAPTASIGLELARAHQPDLVLMDIHLDGISGIQAKSMMNQETRLAHIPVVAVSASALPQDIKETEQLGFVGYITKPFQLDSFLQKIENYLFPAIDKAI